MAGVPKEAKVYTPEQRLKLVANYMLAGMPQNQIAERLAVSPATITRDAAMIREAWSEVATEPIEVMRAQDLARIDRMIQALWPDILKGGKDARLSIDRIERLLARKAAMFGIDAPKLTQQLEATIDLGMASEGTAAKLLDTLTREQQDKLWATMEELGIAIDNDAPPAYSA